jgi:hypothetical protein
MIISSLKNYNEIKHMQWALINDNADPEEYGPVGLICNIIMYDGESEYTPAAGLRLTQVPDEARIGDPGY